MATVVTQLKLRDADAVPGAAFPTPLLTYSSGGGTIANQITLQLAVFPDSVVSGCGWTVIPNVVGTPALTIIIDWYAPAKADGTASTGNATWSIQVAAIAGGAVALTKSFAAVSVTSSAASATANGKARVSFAVTNSDSFSNTNNTLFVKITRDGTAATDTLVGDAVAIGMAVSYSDT